MRHDPAVIHEARVLRQTPTLAEAWLWQELRDRRFRGLKVRRQALVAGRVVTFFCASRRLVILADGDEHGHHPARADLARWGLQVIVLRDADLAQGRDAVLHRLGVALQRPGGAGAAKG